MLYKTLYNQVLSPRSLKACKLQGIIPYELVKKDFKQIKELNYEHNEEKRKRKIEVLIEERAEIIRNEGNELKTHSKQVFF